MEPGRSSTKLTYDDYVLFPDDGLRHEIIDGEHYVTAAPGTRHQAISFRLTHLLAAYLDDHPVGRAFAAPFDVVLSHIDVVEPDLVFLSNSRADLLTEQNLQGAPDLVIEILSPSTKVRDERLKRDLYERAGVNEYWLVDADRHGITIFSRGPRGFEDPIEFTRHAGAPLTTPILPGFALNLDRLFG